MKKSFEKIIEKYNIRKDLENLLSLEDDFDGEDSKGYIGKEDFVYNSLRYIPKMAELIKNKTNIVLGSPIVSHGPDATIDFYWKTDDYVLLMNVSETGPSYFFSDSGKKQEFGNELYPLDS